LSPYTDFVAKSLDFTRELQAIDLCSPVQRADLLAQLICRIGRHLTAYDLLMFHHRGANYPDALLFEEFLAELASMVMEFRHLFDDPGDRSARLRRRGLRTGWMLRRQYSGHPVPDQPTSPGENLRVLPPPFERIPEEQIFAIPRRTKTLFPDRLPILSKPI